MQTFRGNSGLLCLSYKITVILVESPDLANIFSDPMLPFTRISLGQEMFSACFLKAPEAAAYQKDHWTEGRPPGP